MTIANTFTLTSMLTVGNMTVNAPLVVGDGGVLNWSGGTLASSGSLTVASNGVLNIEGAMEIEGALTNAGTVNWQAGVVDVYNDGNGLTGAIWNETNAVWAIQCDEELANAASALAIFNNAGTLLRKSAGSGTTIFNVYLDGSGLVHAQNGTIQFNSGGTLGGSVTDGTGAALVFAAGTLTPVPGFAVSGGGNLTVTFMTIANTFTLTSMLTVGNITVNAPLVVGDGGVLNWSGEIWPAAAR